MQEQTGGGQHEWVQQKALKGATGQHQLELHMGGTLPPLPSLPSPATAACFCSLLGYMARCSSVD